MDAPTSDIPSVLKVLKGMLRARGLHYSDLAAALGKSESSLKRYLSGRRLTLVGLEDICRLLGVSLAEFYEIAAREVGTKPDRLTDEQEEALAADPELMMLLVLLLLGQRVEDVLVDLATDEARLFPLLMRLERLSLVKVYPGNRVRLLVSESLQLRRDSPIRDGFNQVLKQDFMDLDYSGDHALWSVLMAKLSAASVAQLNGLIETFQGQLRAMADRDRKSGADAQWYCIMSNAMEMDLPNYARRVRAARDSLGNGIYDGGATREPGADHDLDLGKQGTPGACKMAS